MNNQLYIVFNKLSLRYEDVFTSPTDATASRKFIGSANNDLDVLQDYELCHIGSVNVETGVVTVSDPRRVAYSQFLKQTKEALNG